MDLPFKFNAKKIIEEGRTTQSAVDIIDQWLYSTSLPHLQDEFIILFLLSCSNDTSATKKTIEAYFRTKNKAPEIFNKWALDTEDMKRFLNVVNFCVIPVRMDNNTAVICTNLNDTNYRNCDVIAGLKMSCMLMNLAQIEDPPNEVVILIDMKGVGFMHLTCIKMKAMISHIEYVQEGMPLKIKNIHVLNSNYIVDKVLDLFKFFIKSELIAGIKTHPPGMSFSDFHEEWIPKNCLPADYGGSLPSLEKLMGGTIEKLKKVQPFFEAEERLRNLVEH